MGFASLNGSSPQKFTMVPCAAACVALPLSASATGIRDASAASVLGIGADDQRKSTEGGVRALLDRGVECVHIDMNDDAHQITSSF